MAKMRAQALQALKVEALPILDKKSFVLFKISVNREKKRLKGHNKPGHPPLRIKIVRDHGQMR